MNNIKMSEMTMVGTWIRHWFPRTHHLNKYYAVHTYSYVTFLTHQCPLSPVWPQSSGGFTMKLMKL